MTTRRVIAIAALCLLAACGDDTGEAASNAPAGKVVAVQGEVTATRAAAGAAARDLEPGADVYADDTIATAAGASAAIELAHNGARWELAGGISRRVDRSPAWRAAAGGGEALLGATDTDRTAAAGRHAERAAADRTTSAERPEAAAAATETAEPTTGAVPLEETAAPAPAPPPSPAPAASAPKREPPAAPPPPEADPAPPPPAKKDKKRSESRRRKPRAMDKGRPVDIDDVLGVDKEAEIGAKLTRQQVQAGLKTIARPLARCAEQHDAGGQVVLVRFTVAPSGKVSRAEARREHAGKPVGACVERAVKSARFARAEQSTTVTYPFRL